MDCLQRRWILARARLPGPVYGWILEVRTLNGGNEFYNAFTVFPTGSNLPVPYAMSPLPIQRANLLGTLSGSAFAGFTNAGSL